MNRLREYGRRWLRWERGRQNTGYDKLLIAINPFVIPFDCYLLRFPEGTLGEDVEERASDPLAFRELMSDAIRYWEPRRLVHNSALALVVLVCFALQWPAAWTRLTFPTVLVVFIFAVLANVAYCAAYLVDIPMQYSSVRREWRRRRWYVLVTGTLFASAVTYLVACGLFFPAE